MLNDRTMVAIFDSKLCANESYRGKHRNHGILSFLDRSISEAVRKRFGADALFTVTLKCGEIPLVPPGKVGKLVIPYEFVGSVVIPPRYLFVLNRSGGPDTIISSAEVSVVAGVGDHTLLQPVDRFEREGVDSPLVKELPGAPREAPYRTCRPGGIEFHQPAFANERSSPAATDGEHLGLRRFAFIKMNHPMGAQSEPGHKHSSAVTAAPFPDDGLPMAAVIAAQEGPTTIKLIDGTTITFAGCDIPFDNVIPDQNMGKCDRPSVFASNSVQKPNPSLTDVSSRTIDMTMRTSVISHQADDFDTLLEPLISARSVVELLYESKQSYGERMTHKAKRATESFEAADDLDLAAIRFVTPRRVLSLYQDELDPKLG